MSYQSSSLVFAIALATRVFVTPSLPAQTPAHAEVTRVELALTNARRVVTEDRSRIAALEVLIDRQRAAIIAGGGWTPPGPDYWERLFTFDGSQKVLANLEAKLDRTERKLARDRARVDSLQGLKVSTR